MPRQNNWQVAKAVRDLISEATRRLLHPAQWGADVVRDQLLRYSIEVSGERQLRHRAAAIGRTGSIKKGRRSVGVKRQYLYRGEAENCQAASFSAMQIPEVLPSTCAIS